MAKRTRTLSRNGNLNRESVTPSLTQDVTWCPLFWLLTWSPPFLLPQQAVPSSSSPRFAPVWSQSLSTFSNVRGAVLPLCIVKFLILLHLLEIVSWCAPFVASRFERTWARRMLSVVLCGRAGASFTVALHARFCKFLKRLRGCATASPNLSNNVSQKTKLGAKAREKPKRDALRQIDWGTQHSLGKI